MSKFWERTAQMETESRSIHDHVREAIVEQIVKTDDSERRAELKEEYYIPTSNSASQWEHEKSEDNYKLGKAIGRLQGLWIGVGATGAGLGLRWLVDRFFKKK